MEVRRRAIDAMVTRFPLNSREVLPISLPMHFALGTNTRCVSLFTCTSPWEIYDYGLQTKIVSPLLGDFFYQRGFNSRATTAISLGEVRAATLRQLDGATSVLAPDAIG